MKKLLVVTITLLFSFLFANPTFAYTVKKGDTMSEIALENNLTIQELADINPHIQNLDLIIPGQTIHTEEIKKAVESLEVSQSYEIYIGKTVDTELPKVTLSSMDTETSSEKIHTPEPMKYSDYEIDLLARLVRAEAQTESFEGKIAVACVVLNRVDSPKFPNTIKEVIYDHGQFQPVSNGEINKPADSDSIAAVKAALTEKRHLASNSLFFYNPAIATSHWLDSRATTVVIGQHVFKK